MKGAAAMPAGGTAGLAQRFRAFPPARVPCMRSRRLPRRIQGDLTSSLANKQPIQQKGNPEMHPGKGPAEGAGKKTNPHPTRSHQRSRKSSHGAAIANPLLQTAALGRGSAVPLV